MKGLAPLVAHVSSPALYLVKASARWTRPRPVGPPARLGDGAPHAASGSAPRLEVVDPGRAAERSWADRSEALQAEARAALRTPFSGPPTWRVV